MQSGGGKKGRWVVEFEAQSPFLPDNFTGWVSADDLRASQLRFVFQTREEAIAFVEKRGLSFSLKDNESPPIHLKSYARNFDADKKEPWTH